MYQATIQIPEELAREAVSEAYSREGAVRYVLDNSELSVDFGDDVDFSSEYRVIEL